MPIDGQLMAIDGPHWTAMAIDEMQCDLSTGYHKKPQTHKFFLWEPKTTIIRQQLMNH